MRDWLRSEKRNNCWLSHSLTQVLNTGTWNKANVNQALVEIMIDRFFLLHLYSIFIIVVQFIEHNHQKTWVIDYVEADVKILNNKEVSFKSKGWSYSCPVVSTSVVLSICTCCIFSVRFCYSSEKIWAIWSGTCPFFI